MSEVKSRRGDEVQGNEIADCKVSFELLRAKAKSWDDERSEESREGGKRQRKVS
jgi:hypothetical protein